MASKEPAMGNTVSRAPEPAESAMENTFKVLCAPSGFVQAPLGKGAGVPPMQADKPFLPKTVCGLCHIWLAAVPTYLPLHSADTGTLI